MPGESVDLRAVLFDLDGVLVDSYRVWFHLLNGAAKELGYPPISPEVFQSCWGQGIEADVEKFFTATPSRRSRSTTAITSAITSSISAWCPRFPGSSRRCGSGRSARR